MKKYILILVLSLALVPAFAQIPGFTIGPKVGATISMYQTDVESLKENAKSSFHFGAFARFGRSVYIQPELLFMNRSGVLVNPAHTASEQTIKLRTIDIPVLFGVKVINLELVNVRIFGGPVGTIVVDREVESKNWDTALTKDDFNRANWGIQFGAGADFLMFTADLRYELGMSDYAKIDIGTLKNNLITVSIGWKLF